MQKLISIIAVLSLCLPVKSVLAIDPNQGQTQTQTTYTNNLKFCEGTVKYKNALLVSNFGTDELDPLNTLGKGYILSIEDGQVETLIPNDGYLSAPKGMAVVTHHLFIADVAKVVVYNLKKLNEKPIVINMPKEDLFVNDIVALGKMLVVSVTNTGKLYGIDVSNLSTLATTKLISLGTVPGANGLCVSGDMFYIASFNPTGISNAQNVIYAASISNPNQPLEKFIPNMPHGQYDGIAISDDGERMYFTSWVTSELSEPAVFMVDLTDPDKYVRTLDFGVKFSGPADITVSKNAIWIPDLPASTVYRFNL